jgi:hypothetical protein
MKIFFISLLFLVGCNNPTDVACKGLDPNSLIRESLKLCVDNCTLIGKKYSDATTDDAGYLKHCSCEPKNKRGE